MPRIPRIYIDNVCYHIMARGTQKNKVFMSSDDRSTYLELLLRAKRKYRISVYAYCLMPNHVHLLVEPPEPYKISKFMHWLNRGYSTYFNVKYGKYGHLWQGRFRSKPILKGDYLLQCASYIEANPIRSNLSNNLHEYHWSSYKERCTFGDMNILDGMKPSI
ncbi:MAG: transposase [Candidatus Omnitrophica bacterium]|nr:transposase [Candidatus Omnitrophota bacterium]MDD5488504.1 transposase [Candidatus Omnitrophota bacterium]